MLNLSCLIDMDIMMIYKLTILQNRYLSHCKQMLLPIVIVVAVIVMVIIAISMITVKLVLISSDILVEFTHARILSSTNSPCNTYPHSCYISIHEYQIKL